MRESEAEEIHPTADICGEMAWPAPAAAFTRPAANHPPRVAVAPIGPAEVDDCSSPQTPQSAWRSSSALQVWLSPTSSYPRVFLLLVTGSFLFALLFGVATRLSCADGPKLIGMRPRGVYPHLISVVTIVCTTLIPANFIAVFIFHFAKTQPNTAEEDETDLTTPSGWWTLAQHIATTALNTLHIRRCRRREEDDDSNSDTADVWPLSEEHLAASSAPFHSVVPINEGHPTAAADADALDKISPSRPSPTSALFSLLSLILSPPFHRLLSLLSFSLTASSIIGLWARNGLAAQLTNVLTLLHENILRGWGEVSTPSGVFYTPAFTRFLEWLLGKEFWFSRLSVICGCIDLTRSFVLLPLWYRHAQWRLQPLPSTPVRLHDIRLAMTPAEMSDPGDSEQAEDEEVEEKEEVEEEDDIQQLVEDCSRDAACKAQWAQNDDEGWSALFFADTATSDSLTSSSSGPTPPFHSAVPSPRQAAPPMSPLTHSPRLSRSCSHSSSISSLSRSVSELSDTTAAVKGSRSVVWVPVVCIACFWYAWTVLQWANFPLAPIFNTLRLLQTIISAYPFYSFLTIFTTLALFLIIDAYRHLRHEAHLIHAFTAEGCSCRLPYLLLLCCLLSMDCIVFLILAPLSDVIRLQYFSTSATWVHRVATICTFYGLMLMWQMMVRYVAMVALPRGSSVAVLFPMQLVEDVWAGHLTTHSQP